MIPIQDIVPRKTTPIVTIGLILINTLVFLLEISLPRPWLHTLTFHLGLIPAKYTEIPFFSILVKDPFYFLSFFTCMFLHGGWIHLIGNMWTLWIFGDNVEDRLGHFRFLLFYFLCGIAASFFHIWMNPHSTMPVIGASGAISGVLGAYYAMFPWARIIVMIPIFFFPFFFEIPALFYIGFWYLMQLFSGTLSVVHGVEGGIAWWAHVGGFVTGVLMHRLFCKKCKYYKDEEIPWGVFLSWGEKQNR